MTTPMKKYQNVSYAELQSYAEHNPNRSSVLESIEVFKEFTTSSHDHLCLTGYTTVNLTPVGVLSVVACIADPGYYSLLPKNIRTQLIIDISTKLQEKTDDLKNTSISCKRKKIYNLIGAAYNGSAFQDKDYLDLYHGIGHMNHIQFIMLKEAINESETALKGDIIFSSDPSNWKREEPVWVVDYRGRWVAISDECVPLHPMVGEWICSMEQKGWIIQWPEVDGTKVELVEKLLTFPSWQETDRKLLKSVLAVRLGRANVLNVFGAWRA